MALSMTKAGTIFLLGREVRTCVIWRRLFYEIDAHVVFDGRPFCSSYRKEDDLYQSEYP